MPQLGRLWGTETKENRRWKHGLAPPDGPPLIVRSKTRPLWRRIANTGAFIPFIGVTWLGAGLLTVAMQILIFVLLKPVSEYWRARLNDAVVWWWFLTIVWVMEWWGNAEVRFFSPDNSFPDGVWAEHTMVLGNHYGDIDWIMGWIVAEKIGVVGSTKSYLKKVTRYLPVLGWSWWLCDFVFMDRTWDKDKDRLYHRFDTLRQHPDEAPMMIGLFCEGTRVSEEKLESSRKWCAETGRPVLEHIMWPRTKGFASSVVALEDKLGAVYSMCVGCPDKSRLPTFGAVLRAEEPYVQMAIKRTPYADMPKEYEEIRRWADQIYVDMDTDLKHMHEKGTFSGVEMYFPRQYISLFSMIFWTVLVQGSLVLYIASGAENALYHVFGIFFVCGALLYFMVRYGERQYKEKKPEQEKKDQ
eukprot:TRINITY_DN43698_c0_g1_i1.p2 TRINITY_DN43698_c0_g1~~TRINITY_DN43698_c0_g1_i1.p2  ORF type:complete len:430 (+),score=159.74 TRINITY_DN43698_c0_g1_i1:52-1290(+)